MRLATFFRCSLLLPLVTPLLLLPFGFNAVLGLLILSLGFGGAQYAVFALVMFVLAGRAESDDQIWRLVFSAPVLFAPVQLVGWVVQGYVEKAFDPQLGGIWEASLPLVLYSLVIGYAYVAISCAVYWVAERLGFVHATKL